MKVVRVLAILLVALASTAFAQDPRELTVEVGEQISLSADGVRSFSEGLRGIVDIRLTDRQDRFIIVGQRPGVTSLLLIMRDGSQVSYRIRVPGGDTPDEVPDGRVEERENVRLDLYFVQLSDSYSHAIGIGFPPSIGGANSTANLNLNWVSGSGGGTTTNINLISQSLLPRIDIAQSNGWARLYRQASVTTVNGEQAQIDVGGEVNVIVAGALQNTIESIEFGTELTCLPRYDPETGRIELQVTADVSDLVDDREVPGRNVSTLTTLVNLELGQAVVLGGVIARTEGRAREGLPGLSQIPILGALFGSHSRSFQESETLLFIVPTIVEPVALQQRNRIQEAIRMYEDYRGGVDEVELVEQPRVPGARPPRPAADEEDDD
ncbi:MAG: type II and III secretion system protein [Myxococcota bacterium]